MDTNSTKVNAKTIIQQKTKIVKDDIDVIIDPTAPFKGQKDIYHILGTINVSSGEATIYQVRDSKGNIFAAKHFKSGLKDDSRQKLLDFLTKLDDNSNIMPIIDYGMHYATPFDIVPYYRDKDITNLGPISIDMLKNVLLPSVLAGIKEIHEHNFVHRDIKPENLFYIRNENKVIIGDFGITSDLKAGINFRRTTIGRGTRGYMAPEINMKNVYKSSDYYSLGVTIVCLIEGRYVFGDDDEATIYRKLLNNSFSNGIKDQTLRQLVRGLTIQDPNGRFGYNEVNAYITGREFKKVMDIDKAEMYKLSKVYHFEGNAYNDFKQLAKAFLDNWKRAVEHLKRGLIESHFDGINSDVVLFVQELLETNTNIDVALSKFLYLINPALGICYKGKSYTIKGILNRMKEVYPNMDEDILEMVKEDVFLFMLINKFKNSPNTENEKMLNYIQKIEDIEDHEIAYYTFLFTNFKKLSVVFRGKPIGRALGIAEVITTSTDNRLAVKIAQDKVFLGYAASEIGIDGMLEIVKKNDGAATKAINFNMIELLYAMTKNDELVNFAHIGFTRWLVSNYDNYSYRGKEAKDILLQLKKIPKITPETDFSIINGIIIDTEMIYNEFMEHYQRDLILKASSDGIFASDGKYYIGIEYEKEMVCEEYLRSINISFNKKYIEELKIIELQKASDKIDEIRNDVEATREEMNLVIKDHLGTEHIKINRRNKWKLSFVIITMFLVFFFSAIVYSNEMIILITGVPFEDFTAWTQYSWLFYILSAMLSFTGFIMLVVCLLNISKESKIISFQDNALKNIEHKFRIFDNLKSTVQNMIKDTGRIRRQSRIDFDPLYTVLDDTKKDLDIISNHRTPSKKARHITYKIGIFVFSYLFIISTSIGAAYNLAETINLNLTLSEGIGISSITYGIYYGITFFVLLVFFSIGIKSEKISGFWGFTFKNLSLVILLCGIFFGINYMLTT